MEGKLMLRSDKLAFYGVPGATPGTFVYHRMQGFTEGSVSKNPKEYKRHYIDESAEQTDVTGYSPVMSFAFDRYVGNKVHDDMAGIIDGEKLGSEAVRPIVVVDLTAPLGEKNAVKRDYAVIADNEGGSLDAYTYSGNFKTKGAQEYGVAVIANDGLSCTYSSEA